MGRNGQEWKTPAYLCGDGLGEVGKSPQSDYLATIGNRAVGQLREAVEEQVPVMPEEFQEKLEPAALEDKEQDEVAPGHLAGLSLTALGVVFGDIGTSPLYAVMMCFSPATGIAPLSANIFGILSLIFWSLIIVISIKYLIYVMNADNHGEGGIMVLMSLVHPGGRVRKPARWILVALGLFGAALLYGDGTITPAISVLSSVGGLSVATEFFKPYIVPITIVIIILLFIFQRQGTKVVGLVFGPIMMVWFITIAILGIGAIIRRPDIIAAINPAHAWQFFWANGWQGFLVLGFVFLAVTGGEALYADMGHFGKFPIRVAWFGLVLPALLLNYFGQGALLLEGHRAIQNPFYFLVPSWGIYPLVLLATMATVIASQAVISGAFSLTRQAIQLGFCPLMKIDHTSEEEIGQVYLGTVNWTMMVATITLVLGFRNTDHLASAYGVAVSTTMVITTILTGVVARELWGWSKPMVGLVSGILLIFDLSFCGANMTKVMAGGWFPLAVAALIYLLMSTWREGKEQLAADLTASRIPVEKYLEEFEQNPPSRAAGTAIYLTGNLEGVPPALIYQLDHNKVVHEKVVFLTILTEDIPRVPSPQKIEIRVLDQNFFRAIARQGFMEPLRMLLIFQRLKSAGLEMDLKETSFFLSRENVIPVKGFKMPLWRAKIFSFMARNAMPIAAFLEIPLDRVIELGVFMKL
jgi:KUP system potassium uptake protein